MDQRCDSSCTAAALQVGSSEIKSQSHKKKKNLNGEEILTGDQQLPWGKETRIKQVEGTRASIVSNILFLHFFNFYHI
jgi:hypothetical protein